MANEFKHASVGTELTQAEYEGTSAHVLDSQAAGDIIYASSTTQLSRLGIGTAGKILQVNSGASAPEWTAALTGVTSVLNTSLVVGRDSDNDIDFATDNTILFRASGADQIKLVDGALAPVSDNDVDLGTSSLEFKDAFFDGTVTSDAFAGPLTGDVTGTATNATHVTVADNESTDENNLIPFIEDTSATGNVGLESDGDFHYNPSSGTVTATTFVGNVTGNVTGNLTGNASGTAATVTGAAQTNITSLGTLTALTVDDVAINGKVITMTGSTDDTAVFTVGTNGTLSIVTTDTAGAAANLQITADGTVDIDSAGVLTLDSGAAINIEPASGSAILLDGTISIDAGVVTGATSITSTAFVGDITGDVTGNADTATALATGRTIAMTGDVAWTSASFDGSGNVTGAGTIQSTAVESGMLNNNVISGQTEITSGLAAADELLYSDGGTLKKVGLDNFVELSPQLATEDTVAVASDYLLFLDGGATGNMNKESVADFVSAIAGTGLTASSGQLTASGGGIDNAVIFRLTSDFTGDADPIATNLEQDDTTADSTLGDSGQVSQTSGVFSFPTRGHYLVQAHALFGNGAADPETNLIIQVTTGSGYSDATVAQGSVYNSSARSVMVAQTIVDVASTSTHKVRFKISGNSGSNTIFGSTSINYTYFTFIRLADTDST